MSTDLPMPRFRAGIVIVAHAAVDFLAFVIVPLLSVLEGRLLLRPEQGALLLAVGGVTSGAIQPVVAWLGDRFNTRMFGILGMFFAVIAVSSVGYAQTFNQLLLIQLIAAAGIGAFHPVGAAAVGRLAGSKRSLGVACFFAAGMLGGMLGNVISPVWVAHFANTGSGEPSVARGLQSLVWISIPGMFLVVALFFAARNVSHMHASDVHGHSQLSAKDRRERWRAVWLLYIGNVCRFTTDMAIITLFVRWTEEMAMVQAGATQLTESLRVEASTMNGPLQAAKQGGMCIAGLAFGWLLRVRHEKAALVIVPLFGAVIITIMPRLEGQSTAMLMAVLAGIGYAGIVPVTISLAQRLLPHRTGLASGLMMGGSWAIAGFVGPQLAQRLYSGYGLNVAFMGAAALMFIAAGAALMIPNRVIRRSAG